jgi:hypothetical protein
VTVYVLANTKTEFKELCRRRRIDRGDALWICTGAGESGVRKLRNRALETTDRVVVHELASRGHRHSEVWGLVRQMQAELRAREQEREKQAGG